VLVTLTFTDGTTAQATSDANGKAAFTLNAGQSYGVTNIQATCPGYTLYSTAGNISIPSTPSGVQLVVMQPVATPVGS